jgi:hypothetical protein
MENTFIRGITEITLHSSTYKRENQVSNCFPMDATMQKAYENTDAENAICN